jgi:hypothetical protein
VFLRSAPVSSSQDPIPVPKRVPADVAARRRARHRNSRSSFFAVLNQILHRQLRVADQRLARAH